jgi:pimeloyl-ACP methyl ester carboxylesterase
MSSVESGYAEVNGTRLYYETTGVGHPFVLIHGYTLDNRMWNNQFDTLSQKYKVIRYDLRGFGKSACPSPDQKYCHTEDLKALLDYLKISKANVMGLSMGGGIAVEFTLEHPERVRALIPVDSTLGGFSYSDEFNAIFKELFSKFSKEGLGSAKTVWMGCQLFEPIFEMPEEASKFSKMVSDYSGWHWSTNSDAMQSITPAAIRRLGEINVPVLVIVGERDMSDFLKIARVMERDIQNAHLVVLDDSGHMSNMENPEAFNREVLSFLGSTR